VGTLYRTGGEYMSEQKSIMGSLIDATIEDFNSILKHGTFTLEDLVRLKKGFELQFQRVEVTKNQIMAGILNHTIDEKEGRASMKDLYAVLQKIEDRAAVLQVFINERKQ
jgi:hypothetical protein